MVIGTLKIDVFIGESNSLKSRRRVVNSLKDRIRSRFNVSVADVGEQDLWQRASLGVAVVSGDRRFVDEVLSKVADVVAGDPRVQIIGRSMEIG